MGTLARCIFSNFLILAGAGADFVMLGGMLAGHSESGGELIERNGKKYKLFYGMSSEMAMKKYSGGVAEYRYVWRASTCVFVVNMTLWKMTFLPSEKCRVSFLREKW